MAYVRKRGKQLLIVQGIRESESGKVGQRILFTIYSKAEALSILGQSNGEHASQFKYLLESQYPEIKLDWNALRNGIRENLDVLPDLYEYKETRLRSKFRHDLSAFARQLMLTDPQEFVSAQNLLQEHRIELEYLTRLVQWRLNLPKQERNEWNKDNPFFWRFTLQGTKVPPQIEEELAGYYERGEYERASILFRFLIDCFGDYAEGYNYLGLISLQTEKIEEAIQHFQKGMELGRKQFPRNMARSKYWEDLATRPYMRAMRNLTLALNRGGRYEEALDYCARLEHECGDEIPVAAYRASIYLNTSRWAEAESAALKLHQIDASESLTTAFAQFELGRTQEAMASFLHGAINYPRAARMLVGIRTDSPGSYDGAQDHNTGIEIQRDLNRYLSKQGRKARQFFRTFLEHPHVHAIVAEIENVRQRRLEQHRSGYREAFDRMTQMERMEFARQEVEKVTGLLQ